MERAAPLSSQPLAGTASRLFRPSGFISVETTDRQNPMNENAERSSRQAPGCTFGCAVLGAVLLASFSLAVISWLVVDSLPRSVVFDSAFAVGIGGGCGDPYLLYDANGNGYSKLWGVVHYVGPAPLYSLDESILGELEQNDAGCPSTPPKIDPATAVMGEAVYPIHIEIAGPPRGSMREGESGILSLELKLTDSFDGESPFAYTRKGDEITATLRLDASSFEVSPDNEEMPPLAIPFEDSSRAQWVLSPKEPTLGMQVVSLTISMPRQTLTYDINLDIRTVLGLRPADAAIIGLVGGFIAGSLTAANNSTKLWDWIRTRRKGPVLHPNPVDGQDHVAKPDAS